MNKQFSTADTNLYMNLFYLFKQNNSTEGHTVRAKWADGTPAHTIFMSDVTERYDISKGEFPIITLRPIAVKSAIKEMLWIYQDQSNDLNLLRDKYNVTWWDEWDIGNRTIGQCYGATVKKYNLVDKLLNGLIEEPYARRHIISLWQEDDFSQKHGLKPCAFLTVWTVVGNKLNLYLLQRSSDVMMANSINKIQYVALQMMVARHVGLEPGIFTHHVNNYHIYDRHIPAAKEIMRRYNDKWYDGERKDPKLELSDKKKNFYDFTIDDFTLINYNPMEKLKNPLEIAI